MNRERIDREYEKTLLELASDPNPENLRKLQGLFEQGPKAEPTSQEYSRSKRKIQTITDESSNDLARPEFWSRVVDEARNLACKGAGQPNKTQANELASKETNSCHKQAVGVTEKENVSQAALGMRSECA